MQTIMITGCSSGFGLETARYFLEQGWKVIATMRAPQEGVLPASDRLRLVRLDVTSAQSIAEAIAEVGEIDVLVNNAGVGMLNALEGAPREAIANLFATNTLGTIAMTQAVIPRFRERRSGTIVNITSAVTLQPMPLLAVYTASKAAVNAFTESLALELRAFNIRVGLILPGRAPQTRFGENARRLVDIDRPGINWVGLSRSLGVPAVRADKAEQLAGHIKRAIKEPGPHLIEMMVKP